MTPRPLACNLASNQTHKHRWRIPNYENVSPPTSLRGWVCITAPGPDCKSGCYAEMYQDNFGRFFIL